ncbi:iron uptake transporter permease EfeU [Nostoc sp. 'Lobaria pulmonaria (5183) cyanobiont']|uniref:iron uptake transporter permease EfeU n=1 Tax=Nostoc sp. 'Lobaria pulmonaria (5183) cyanobiont' TaxID=1618022 RepID=UPI000CF3365D|nr:iron uptake transporter permease EfeU [Nostoc sp. 'Lobaria pulmonaria (5183) cyanobiont']AVH70103.1 iron permease FTR1 [Nostoc sp. 'Lobaria pulmonaria (5183) cyanobiont']
MLFPFLIMFREGVEAALVVGIIASYLKQTGRTHLMKSVWIGIVLATFVCLAAAIFLQISSQDFPQQEQELFAAVISIVAVGVLTWMVFWMRRAARSIKGELQSQVEAAIQSGDKGGIALVGMAFFAVLREGLETVVFLLATFQQNLGIQAPVGALFGYAAAVAVGVGIYQGGIRINLRRFFKWTGAFIILVAAGLLASGVRAFHEAGVWNSLQTVVFDASGILPNNGFVGSLLAGFFGYNDAPTVSEVIVYFGYLIPTMLLFLLGGNAGQKTTTSHS